MQDYYIILSRSRTFLALIIQAVSGKYYNHTSLSFDKNLEEIYSFGRRYVRFMLPAGFVTEGVNHGFFAAHPNNMVCVLKGSMTQSEYEQVQKHLQPFIDDPKKYTYGIIQLLKVKLGKDYTQGNKYVCSVFVAYLLKDVLNIGDRYKYIQPEDFFAFGLEKVYEGKVGDYRYEQ